jgi:hypothetical protein
MFCKCVLGHVRRSCTIYINGMKSKYPGFNYHRKFDSFESTYFTPTLFDMIRICKHEKAISIGDTSLVVIVAQIN